MREMGKMGEAYRCRFFILWLGQDKEDKDGKKTWGKNRTKLGSVKLASKSRNALFSVLTLPCLLVYLSSLSYLNPHLKKPTLVRCGGELTGVGFLFYGWDKTRRTRKERRQGGKTVQHFVRSN
jgi:hypothetical protein